MLGMDDDALHSRVQISHRDIIIGASLPAMMMGDNADATPTTMTMTTIMTS
jgi:hypothetical protein